MSTEKKKPSQILSEAIDTLTKWEWGQDSFYDFMLDDKQTPCLCAHGSIQYCGSSTVRDQIDFRIRPNTHEAPNDRVLDVVIKYQDAKDNWKNISENQSLFLAHYYAWKVGCTYDFNDEPGRTKRQVIKKLREAVSLAQSEGQ